MKFNAFLIREAMDPCETPADKAALAFRIANADDDVSLAVLSEARAAIGAITNTETTMTMYTQADMDAAAAKAVAQVLADWQATGSVAALEQTANATAPVAKPAPAAAIPAPVAAAVNPAVNLQAVATAKEWGAARRRLA